MRRERAVEILNSLKQYYNDKNVDSYVGFDDEDNEALDLAIKALGQTELDSSYNGVKTELEPCEDCISREDVMRILKTLYNFDDLKDLKVKQQEVMNLPSVTPQRPKGKWIQTKDECDGTNFYDFSFECTECGKEQSFKSNYCPNCGADMEEVEK